MVSCGSAGNNKVVRCSSVVVVVYRAVVVLWIVWYLVLVLWIELWMVEKGENSLARFTQTKTPLFMITF